MDDARFPGRTRALNADSEIQLRLLDVQALDLRVDQLGHRRRTLPEISELEELSTEHVRLRDAEVVASTRVKDLEQQQKRADADVEQVRARKDRDQIRLDSGQVSSPKELESLQSEIVSLNRRQSELEDIELEVMETLEAAQREVESLAADRDKTGQREQDVQATRDATWAEIDTESASAKEERAALVADVPDELLKLYERIRANQGGIGAAALKQRRCEGCRMQLDAAEFNRVRDLAADVVVRHEECGRILVRTPESGL